MDISSKNSTNVLQADSQQLQHKRRFRRGRNLPKRSVDLLRKWLIDHRYCAYPTEDDKARLAADTGLDVMQISNWFINARRRILPGILGNDILLQKRSHVCHKEHVYQMFRGLKMDHTSPMGQSTRQTSNVEACLAAASSDESSAHLGGSAICEDHGVQPRISKASQYIKIEKYFPAPSQESRVSSNSVAATCGIEIPLQELVPLKPRKRWQYTFEQGRCVLNISNRPSTSSRRLVGHGVRSAARDHDCYSQVRSGEMFSRKKQEVQDGLSCGVSRTESLNSSAASSYDLDLYGRFDVLVEVACSERENRIANDCRNQIFNQF